MDNTGRRCESCWCRKIKSSAKVGRMKSRMFWSLWVTLRINWSETDTVFTTVRFILCDRDRFPNRIAKGPPTGSHSGKRSTLEADCRPVGSGWAQNWLKQHMCECLLVSRHPPLVYPSYIYFPSDNSHFRPYLFYHRPHCVPFQDRLARYLRHCMHVHIPRYHDRSSCAAIVPCISVKRRSIVCSIAVQIPSVASLPPSERLGIKERYLASTAHTGLFSRKGSAEPLGAYSYIRRAKAIHIWYY